MEHTATQWRPPAGAALFIRSTGSVAAAALLFASGAAALGWQIIWTSAFAVPLGHELAGVLAVAAAFFTGLAAGALLLARRIERSPRPARWYAGLEILTGLAGLGATTLLPRITPDIAALLGPQPAPALHAALAFSVPLVLLLPATLAMGATLPALERQLRSDTLSPLPALYAANTAGALAGLLGAIFLVLPALGLRQSAWLCAGLNLACGATALLLWRAAPGTRRGSATDGAQTLATGAPGAVPVVEGVQVAAGRHSTTARRLGLRLAATGLLGIGYEVLVLRVLSQVCENTVYTYGLLLASFLLATTVGAACEQRARSVRAADGLLTALALALLASGAALYGARALQQGVDEALGGGFAAGLAAEAAVGALAMLLPAGVMGALFSRLCRQATDAGWPLGRALALNTAGAALAPLLVGTLLAPWAGARDTLVLLAAGYLLLLARPAWDSAWPAAAAAAAAVLALAGPPLRFIDMQDGSRLLRWSEGAMAAVSVVADADDVARLRINNRVQEGSTAGGNVEARLAQIPLLLHPQPAEALFLGLGTGYTANAAAADPAVHVRAVELLPEVAQMSGLFMMRPAAPRAAAPVDVVVADARRFVLADTQRYDVIVADLFHPARSGAASLYTAEHFAAVRERLAPGGLFCQWLALHQMDLPTLRSIVAAFLQAYPDGAMLLAGNSLDSPVVGLVARPGVPGWRLADVQARLVPRRGGMQAALETARIDGPYAVMGSFLADTEALRGFAAGAEPNTDDRPVVAQQAARTDYAPEATPRQRLAALLDALPQPPQGVLRAGDPAAQRLAAYWNARQRYLRAGMAVRPDPDPRALLDSAGPPLLDIVRASPEFQPAADALIALAQGVQGSDYLLSQRILNAVRQAQAAAPEANPNANRP